MSEIDLSDRPIEIWDIGRLIPYERNAKKHSADQIEKLAALILKNRVITPMVVEENGTIIAGHGRRLACLKAGIVKVPVVVCYGMTKLAAGALRLADNAIVSTEYDYQVMQEEVVILHAEGVNADDLAMDQKDVSQMLTEGMGEMDMTQFTDDISASVAEKAEDNRRKEEEADAASAPVSDAFGFKRVTVEQSRAIRQFMVIAETRTGLTGVAALIAYIASVK